MKAKPLRNRTPEMEQFLRERFGKYCYSDISDMFFERFGWRLSEQSLKTLKIRWKIPGRAPMPKHCSEKYSPAIDAEIRAIVAEGHKDEETAKILTERTGVQYTMDQIKAYRTRMHIPSLNDGKFAKGHIPYSKGKKWDDFIDKEAQERARKTCYKKGHKPYNTAPVGATAVRDNREWVKYKDHDDEHHRFCWKQANRLELEKDGVIVEKGAVILHLDGDPRSRDKDNYLICSKEEATSILHRNLVVPDKDIMQTVSLMTKVRLQEQKLRKERKKERKKRAEQT